MGIHAGLTGHGSRGDWGVEAEVPGGTASEPLVGTTARPGKCLGQSVVRGRARDTNSQQSWLLLGQSSDTGLGAVSGFQGSAGQ